MEYTIDCKDLVEVKVSLFLCRHCLNKVTINMDQQQIKKSELKDVVCSYCNTVYEILT